MMDSASFSCVNKAYRFGLMKFGHTGFHMLAQRTTRFSVSCVKVQKV